MGTVAYRDLEFTQIDAGAKVGGLSREKLVDDVMLGGEVGGAGRPGAGAVGAGSGVGHALRLTGARTLCLRAMEGARVAVNGRAGRRTVCVLDGKGLAVEVLDMAEEEEMGE